MADQAGKSSVPLVELMAQLQWSQTGSQAADARGMSVLSPARLVDAREASPTFLERFEQMVGSQGFDLKTLVWSSYPPKAFTGEPASRFYRSDVGDGRFYQIEPGRFQANARPPHHAWKSVEGFINDGIDASVKAAEGLSEFRNWKVDARLEYLDAFEPGADGIEGFLKSMCRITLDRPTYLDRFVKGEVAGGADGGVLTPSWAVELPVGDNMIMVLHVRMGVIDAESRILMSSIVYSIEPLSAELGALTHFFDHAHERIHSLYLAINEIEA